MTQLTHGGDWADKRVLHLVKTVQYTRETDV